jgi:hypothetical protein
LNKDEWDRLLELYIISNGPVDLPIIPVIIPVIPVVPVNLVPKVEPVKVPSVKTVEPLKASTQAVNFFTDEVTLLKVEPKENLFYNVSLKPEVEFRKPVEPIIPVKVVEPLPVKSVSFLPLLRDMVASGNQPDDQTVMLLMNAYQRVNDKEGAYIYLCMLCM